MQGEEDILARFELAASTQKTWSGKGGWKAIPLAGGAMRLERVLGLRLAGASIDGLQARLVCRGDLPEMDVYGHLEMYIPELPGYGHFQRASWRPLKTHTNSGSAPGALRLATMRDRREPFHLNRQLGIAGLRQLVLGVAEPLPSGIGGFRDLLIFLGEYWRITSLDAISDPPWEKRLL